MKIKIFTKTDAYFSKKSKGMTALESDVSAWLDSHPNIKIVDIKQNSSGGSLEPATIVISIWYEEK